MVKEEAAFDAFSDILCDNKFAGLSIGGDKIDSGRTRLDVERFQLGQRVLHPLRFLNSSFRLGRAGLGAAPQPLDFATDPASQHLLPSALSLQVFLAPNQKIAVRSIDTQIAIGVGPIELHHPVRRVLQEISIVTY